LKRAQAPRNEQGGAPIGQRKRKQRQGDEDGARSDEDGQRAIQSDGCQQAAKRVAGSRAGRFKA
jgi:hypothetical protein